MYPPRKILKNSILRKCSAELHHTQLHNTFFNPRFRQIFDKFLSFFLPFFLSTHQSIFFSLKNRIYKLLILSCRPKMACCRLSRQLHATPRQAVDSVDSLLRPCGKPTTQSTASCDPAASPRLGRQPPATPRQARDSVDSLPRPRDKPTTRSTASCDPAASPRPKFEQNLSKNQHINRMFN